MTVKELEQITINALKSGSLEAFNLSYDLYFKALCSFANYFVKKPHIAEEIVQEIFLNLWMNRDSLPVQISLKSYLLKIVKNDCLDYLKHQKVKEKFAVEYLNSTSDAYDDIFNDLINEDLQKSLNNAIVKLPNQCRQIFKMSRFLYLSYKEIAGELNISVKTVENQIGKALKIVREELNPHL